MDPKEQELQENFDRATQDLVEAARIFQQYVDRMFVKIRGDIKPMTIVEQEKMSAASMLLHQAQQNVIYANSALRDYQNRHRMDEPHSVS